jgi:hypothetical protein
LHQFGTSEANEIGGRHAAINKSIVGSTPNPQYPAQPEGSWCNQDALVPDEPPLGYEIDAQEAVGTAQEIQTSLDDAERASAESTHRSAAPASSPGDGAECPASSLRLRRPQFIRP